MGCFITALAISIKGARIVRKRFPDFKPDMSVFERAAAIIRLLIISILPLLHIAFFLVFIAKEDEILEQALEKAENEMSE